MGQNADGDARADEGGMGGIGTLTGWQAIAADVEAEAELGADVANGDAPGATRAIVTAAQTNARDPLASFISGSTGGTGEGGASGPGSRSGFNDRYELLKMIGSGSFGQVWMARRRSDDALVAVKKIDVGAMTEKARMDCRNEVDVLRMLNHPNVTRYHEAAVESQHLNIVMEFVSEGDLGARVKQVVAERGGDSRGPGSNSPRELAGSDEGGALTEDEVMWYFVQICLALHHLHGRGVLHRDLKAQNIFIAAGDIVKLGDFGISKVLGTQTGFCSTVVGTPYYLSPEICLGKSYNKKSDIWALGCVLYELCTQRHAFGANSLPALIMKILKGTYPPLPKSWSQELRDLQTSLLQLEPRCRPTIADIIRLPVVKRHLERYSAKVGCSPSLRRAGSLEKAAVNMLRDAAGATNGTAARRAPITRAERKPTPGLGAHRRPTSHAPTAAPAHGIERERRRLVREIERESDLAARREASEVGRRRREAEKAAEAQEMAQKDRVRRTNARLVRQAKEAGKAAAEAAARRLAAEHKRKVEAARPRLDRRALNPAFVKAAKEPPLTIPEEPREQQAKARADADFDVVRSPPMRMGSGSSAPTHSDDGSIDDASAALPGGTTRLDDGRFAVSVSAAKEEDGNIIIDETESMDEPYSDDDHHESEGDKSTEGTIETDEDIEEDIDYQGVSRGLSASIEGARALMEQLVTMNVQEPPEMEEPPVVTTAVPPRSTAFVVSFSPPEKKSSDDGVGYNEESSSRDDGKDDDPVHLGHLRGQCISELGVKLFSKAYQQAKSAAAMAADGGDVDTSALLRVLGEGKGHCAPLLEMLVLLEGVQLREEVRLSKKG